MKRGQNTTQPHAALLRNTSGIDTPVKNSLCCAAAGIFAPLSSTTEALTPHEKLREAASLEATLIAQNCSPAQPVLGHVASMRHCSRLFSRFGITRPTLKGNLRLCGFIPVDTCNDFSCFLQFIATVFKLLNSARIATSNNFKSLFGPLGSILSIRNMLLNNKDRVKRSCGKQRVPQAPQRISYCDNSSQPDHIRRGNGKRCGLNNSRIGFVCSILRKMKRIDFLLGFFFSPGPSLQLMGVLSHRKSTHNCRDRTKSLDPGRSVFRYFKSFQQNEKHPSYRADSKPQPKQPHRGRSHVRWNLKLLHALSPNPLKRAARLPTFVTSVHGGLA